MEVFKGLASVAYLNFEHCSPLGGEWCDDTQNERPDAAALLTDYGRGPLRSGHCYLGPLLL